MEVVFATVELRLSTLAAEPWGFKYTSSSCGADVVLCYFMFCSCWCLSLNSPSVCSTTEQRMPTSSSNEHYLITLVELSSLFLPVQAVFVLSCAALGI